ncbi:MAG TPA: F0F1 ATP synthase subunit A [Candidatus Saccharimonadales bacterium]|nr:F0F1 ATP synthase subunit A [Candidatus Saccharimonadales bacterium]
MSVMTLFAADGPAIHVAPAPAFHLWGFTITNSILYGWACAVIIIALLIGVARKVSVRPRGGFSQFIEAGAEFISDLVEGAFDNRAVGRKYVPFFVTLFFFILLNNWFGLIPGVGEAFTRGDNPILRPFTADLNGTFAMGIVTMLFVYISSVRESGGIRRYFAHFFVGSPLNPLYLIIGLLEMLTDLTRVFSLSLRLFLNVTIGEIVIAVFAYLGHAAAPVTALPFTLIELFVGALQAYIFTMLALMYLAIAVNHAGHHADEVEDTATHTLTPESTPDRAEVRKAKIA